MYRPCDNNQLQYILCNLFFVSVNYFRGRNVRRIIITVQETREKFRKNTIWSLLRF